MQAEFSVELGADDPTLAVPWSDPEERWRYLDLHANPELVAEIEEAKDFPEMREFLTTVNAAASNLLSAKCDAWFSREITEEDATFGAPAKFGSYVDVAFRLPAPQTSFAMHEAFALRLVELLRRAPELPASMEAIIRRAHFEDPDGNVREGFYFTLYVTGYGEDAAEAKQACGIALRLAGHATLQMSTGRGIAGQAG
ncbi:MAG TPA: hypothetical protein VMU28_10215 [Terriglobales bacterium]|nr:hypothetical protein [Terriglobales bacterium]